MSATQKSYEYNPDSVVVNVMDPNFIKDGKFDIDKFNNMFLIETSKMKDQALQSDEQKLQYLNYLANRPKQLTDKTIGEIIVGCGTAWFDIFDDLFKYGFTRSVFITDNRLFYIGLTFIIIALLLLIISYIYNQR